MKHSSTKPHCSKTCLPKRVFDLLAVSMIVALALGITYPWISDPFGISIGHMDWTYPVPGTDFMRSLALSGWMHFAPMELHEWPLAHSRYHMFPTGASHALSVDGLLLGGIVALLNFMLPLQTAWSAGLVLAFVLSGVMVYRFSYRRFGRGLLALALAASATCLPYIQQRAAFHPNLCHVWVMPLAIHLALNFHRRPSAKRALAWGLSFPLLALSSSYIMIAGICFQACASLGMLAEWRAWRFWSDARLRGMLLAWGVGIAGVTLVMLQMLLHMEGRAATNPEDLALYSVPLVQYLLPHPESWMGRQPYFQALQMRVGTNWEALAGGPLAALLLAPLFLLMRRAPGPRWVLGMALLGGLLLSSGPQLKIFSAEPLHHGMPLPLLALTKLSHRFDAIRHPGRMHPMIMYLALFAAGYLLAWLRGAWSATLLRRTAWRGAVLAALALNLLWSANFGKFYVYETIDPIPGLQQIAAPTVPTSRAMPGAVLDIPASYYWFAHYSFQQLTHQRPMVWSLSGFFHDAVRWDSLKFMVKDPLLRFFVVEQDVNAPSWNEETVAQIASEDFMRKLAADAIEYVIVHPQELKFIVGTGVARAETPAYYDRIEAAWAGHKIYEDQWVRIYKTGTLPP